MAAGTKNGQEKDCCWIDIVSLNPADLFFTEHSLIDGSDNPQAPVPLSQLDSVSKAIADVVNSFPDDSPVTPIIRILAGADEKKTADDYWKTYGYRFDKIFWTQEKKDGDLVPLITNKKAKVYVGYYGPTFKSE